jgi:hypothetical protein
MMALPPGGSINWVLKAFDLRPKPGCRDLPQVCQFMVFEVCLFVFRQAVKEDRPITEK